jgi:hypothetical protein
VFKWGSGTPKASARPPLNALCLHYPDCALGNASGGSSRHSRPTLAWWNGTVFEGVLEIMVTRPLKNARVVELIRHKYRSSNNQRIRSFHFL